MTHIITSLCLRDSSCSDVCPVECISPGDYDENQTTYVIDSSTCIDCGACVPECPFHAIYPEDEVPTAFRAKGGEIINQPGLSGYFEHVSHHGETIALHSVRQLEKGEIIDLTRQSV